MTGRVPPHTRRRREDGNGADGQRVVDRVRVEAAANHVQTVNGLWETRALTQIKVKFSKV